MTRVCVSFVCGLLFLSAGATAARAQTPSQAAAPADDVRRVRDELDRLRKEFDALRRVYDDRLTELERRLAQMGGGPQAPVTPPADSTSQAQQTTPPPTDPQAPQTPMPAGSGKVFNPDISVNGNFIGAAGRNPFATLSPLQLSEVEAAFQSIVDPYARADFFLSAGTEGMEVEEGY